MRVRMTLAVSRFDMVYKGTKPSFAQGAGGVLVTQIARNMEILFHYLARRFFLDVHRRRRARRSLSTRCH